MRADLLSGAKTIVAVVVLLGVGYWYDGWREDQEHLKTCIHQMTYEAARFDGFFVVQESVYKERRGGRLIVSASAEKPIDSLSQLPAAQSLSVASDSVYLIRCTVIERGVMTAYIVEKTSPSLDWISVAPRER